MHNNIKDKTSLKQETINAINLQVSSNWGYFDKRND